MNIKSHIAVSIRQNIRISGLNRITSDASLRFRSYPSVIKKAIYEKIWDNVWHPIRDNIVLGNLEFKDLI